jgi:putative phosphoribosyl transferase
MSAEEMVRAVEVYFDGATLDGDLVVPRGATGIVLFAHGSGSSRSSPRNRHVARALNEAGVGTLLIDLVIGDEGVRIGVPTTSTSATRC